MKIFHASRSWKRIFSFSVFVQDQSWVTFHLQKKTWNRRIFCEITFFFVKTFFFTSASLQIGLVSSLVQSILAILTSFLTEYWVAKRSHLGANFWQCPHHGAKNLTKVYPGCLISFSKSSFVDRILDSEGSGLSLLSLTNCWSSFKVLGKNVKFWFHEFFLFLR